LGKTNPLNDTDLKEFIELQKGFEDSVKSWSLATTELDTDSKGSGTWDLSVKNPNQAEEAPLREPQAIIEEIIALDKESEAILGKIQELL
jgi:type I restriction enzyme M protein